MQEVVRRCDRLIGTKGKRCGERVPGDEPTRFMFEDVGYEADLCDKHRDEFQASIQAVLHIAEPTTARAGSAMRKAMRGKKGITFTTKEVREWAIAQGREVPPSGRLPNTLINEFKEVQRG